MRNQIRATHFRFSFSRILLVLASALLPGHAGAHDYRLGTIQIEHPWALATPGRAKTGAGYLKITNHGTAPDRLISLSSPASQRVQIHQTSNDGTVAKMRPLEKGLEIKPGETVELSPGGMHIMFEGLRAPLIEANRVKGTLVFEQAGTLEVEYTIEPMGTKSTPAGHKH
jgi:copper(I)-binding protein